jgi:threonine/homoserine/homoserine lactone efflux protein
MKLDKENLIKGIGIMIFGTLTTMFLIWVSTPFVIKESLHIMTILAYAYLVFMIFLGILQMNQKVNENDDSDM